jgi:hypothetical protein
MQFTPAEYWFDESAQAAVITINVGWPGVKDVMQ